MTDEKTQQPLGVASDLNAELDIQFSVIEKETEKAYQFGLDLAEGYYIKIWFPKSMISRIDKVNDTAKVAKSLFIQKIYEKADKKEAEDYLKTLNI